MWTLNKSPVTTPTPDPPSLQPCMLYRLLFQLRNKTNLNPIELQTMGKTSAFPDIFPGKRMMMNMDNGKMERKEVQDTAAIIAWFTSSIPVSTGQRGNGF